MFYFFSGLLIYLIIGLCLGVFFYFTSLTQQDQEILSATDELILIIYTSSMWGWDLLQVLYEMVTKKDTEGY